MTRSKLNGDYAIFCYYFVDCSTTPEAETVGER